MGEIVEAVVVGGGPAGLAAAGWLGRYRRRTLLVDAGEGRNRWADAMHGLIGQDTARPEVVRERALRELAAYPELALRHGRVRRATVLDGGGFEVDVGGDRIRARRIVLATGVRDAFPEVEGFLDFYGADVHHCPTCDGYEARDQRVVAIGWERHVAGFAVSLLDWAQEVRIVTDGHPLEAEDEVRRALDDRGVEILEERAAALVGARGALRCLRLADGTEVPCSMAFFSIAHQPVTDLAEQLGCDLDPEGYVVVDRECRTTVPGVYAAGDLIPGMQLVAVAMGAGTVAGVACATSLQGEAPLPGTPTRAPDPDQVLDGR